MILDKIIFRIFIISLKFVCRKGKKFGVKYWKIFVVLYVIFEKKEFLREVVFMVFIII